MKLLVCLITIVFCLQAQALVLNFECTASNPSLKVLRENRLRELHHFFQDIESRLPDDARLAMKNEIVTVICKKNLPGAGLFPDPDTTGGRYELWIDASYVDSQETEEILSHEFFHLIHYYLHPNEEAWMREGLAQIFAWRVAGRPNSKNLVAGLKIPGVELMSQIDPSRIQPEAYGHSFLYFFYLWKNCGGDSLFWDLTRSGPGFFGARGIDAVLKGRRKSDSLEQCLSFRQSALDFELSRVCNSETQLSNGQSSDHFLWPTTVLSRTVAQSLSLQDLKELAPYQPLLLSPLVPLPDLNGPFLRVYWFQNSFPHLLLKEKPQGDLSDWVQIIIRELPQ